MSWKCPSENSLRRNVFKHKCRLFEPCMIRRKHFINMRSFHELYEMLNYLNSESLQLGLKMKGHKAMYCSERS